jgi:hypothetical protein
MSRLWSQQNMKYLKKNNKTETYNKYIFLMLYISALITRERNLAITRQRASYLAKRREVIRSSDSADWVTWRRDAENKK